MAYLFSEDFNPWMRGVAVLAESVAKNRTPLPEDHPLVEKERELIGQVSDAMENAREARDSAYEQTFGLLYGGANPSDASLAALTLAALMHHRSPGATPAKTAPSESSFHCAPQPEYACCPIPE